MTLRELIVWRPDPGRRWAVVVAVIMLTLFIGVLHWEAGLAYEFHVFFTLPVVLVAWYVGAGFGYGFAGLVVLLWLIADGLLMGPAMEPLPFAFNTLARLVVEFATVWLLSSLRNLLKRETQLAREDSLTGLANPRAFAELGRRALAQAARERTPFTAVFIDLDRFKEVNDQYGHGVGDTLLRSVAHELQRHSRAGDVLGRLGGDEFALLLPGMDTTGAEGYVGALRHHLLAAMRQGGWPVTFSIGVASFKAATADLDGLLAAADGLMYEVKNANRDGILMRAIDAAA